MTLKTLKTKQEYEKIIQCGHGYLISQFLNGRISNREDP